MGEPLIGDVSLLGVHVQNWMLVVTAFFVFWLLFVWMKRQ